MPKAYVPQGSHIKENRRLQEENDSLRKEVSARGDAIKALEQEIFDLKKRLKRADSFKSELIQEAAAMNEVW